MLEKLLKCHQCWSKCWKCAVVQRAASNRCSTAEHPSPEPHLDENISSFKDRLFFSPDSLINCSPGFKLISRTSDFAPVTGCHGSARNHRPRPRYCLLCLRGRKPQMKRVHLREQITLQEFQIRTRSSGPSGSDGLFCLGSGFSIGSGLLFRFA